MSAISSPMRIRLMSQMMPHGWKGLSAANQYEMIVVSRKSKTRNGINPNAGYKTNIGSSHILYCGGYEG